MIKELELKNTIEDVINTLSLYDRSCKISMGMCINHAKSILSKAIKIEKDSNQLNLF